VAREFVGRWSGRVQPSAEKQHDDFVTALRTPESAVLLGKYSLTEYAMYRRGDALEVIFKSEKPEIIAGFLKNKRMWPDYWEFEAPGEADVPADKPLVFRWARE
jgi:hypothetical protein